MSKKPIDVAFKSDGPDYRGIPTHICPCGSELFHIIAQFHERRVALYFTTGQCTQCKALVTLPTEADDDISV